MSWHEEFNIIMSMVDGPIKVGDINSFATQAANSVG